MLECTWRISYSFHLHCAIHDLLTSICIYLGQYVQLGSNTRSEITGDKIITLCIFSFVFSKCLAIIWQHSGQKNKRRLYGNILYKLKNSLSFSVSKMVFHKSTSLNLCHLTSGNGLQIFHSNHRLCLTLSKSLVWNSSRFINGIWSMKRTYFYLKYFLQKIFNCYSWNIFTGRKISFCPTFDSVFI